MKLHIGTDHAGFALKTRLLAHLQAQGHTVVDHGALTTERSDYPDYAARVARAVRDDAHSLGILVCGSGLGMCISANKVAGIRAISPWTPEIAALARSHNDANVVCVGERLVPEADARAIVDAFVAGRFEGGRHAARLEKIKRLEQEEAAALAPVAPRG